MQLLQGAFSTVGSQSSMYVVIFCFFSCLCLHFCRSCMTLTVDFVLAVSMVMFSTFEHSVELIYHHLIQRTKEDCSRMQQLGVTCLAGYTAGAVGTVISTPADNIVSSLYNRKADSVLQAVRSIGVANLFTRSLSIRIALVGPVVTLQWFFYDTIKVLNGLPTSGGLSREHEDGGISA
ncbi:unnamed protein product [Linum tenue]|uniref:Uncharacterized protein n=1 Tax=Linum tenue TaxID=586396 RepID=A0AAV0PKC2_9ROSI|nr:unnamed protein product [Linum tenue]